MSMFPKCTCKNSISGVCVGGSTCTNPIVLEQVGIKPVHAKPSLYTHYFIYLKEIATRYGYNLVLHGSMNRDLDLIAIPWEQEIGNMKDMVQTMADFLGGCLQPLTEADYVFAESHHGRYRYVIDLNRGGKSTNYSDPQYYIDISVINKA